MEPEVLAMPNNGSKKCCNCSLSNGGTWDRSVKRKFEQIGNGMQEVMPAAFDYGAVAHVEIENECRALREALSSSQQTIQELYTELEEERNASSSAANEAMSMILRLQREKAEVQMEARQFKRFAEEKMAHDQEELLGLEDLLYKREQAIQALNFEVQAYRHRMLSFGLTEAELEGDKGSYSRSQSFVENFYAPDEFPPADYPPLKCNVNENQGPIDVDEDIIDIEKYAFGETPRANFGETPHTREYLQNLDFRLHQLEKTSKSNQMGRNFSGTMNISEKPVVGQSPKRTHLRKFSTDSSSSFYGQAKEMGPVPGVDNPMPSNSFKKEFSHPTEYSNMKKVENASELGDDMNDRVYTIDSIHHGEPKNIITGSKAGIEVSEDYLDTPMESLNQADVRDPDIKKLYTRLQALEADRESMRQAIISMRTDKAQLVLLKEIAQQLCKEVSPERRMPVKKPSIVGGFSIMSAVKWIVSFVFWKKKAHRSKYTFGLTPNNVGLLLLLDRSNLARQSRCLTRAQTQARVTLT
ncbi:hypothetical protein Sjap_012584 [Stephania japonica]|uniref:GTD-binding domain-containing protein n=1 Tax=Stephania japonica TaxID=461633 RepID=A0AAP0IW70_9MAGN